jgi:hypothetical protein
MGEEARMSNESGRRLYMAAVKFSIALAKENVRGPLSVGTPAAGFDALAAYLLKGGGVRGRKRKPHRRRCHASSPGWERRDHEGAHMSGNTVKIKAVLVKETALAGLYETDEGEVWIPKSQIVDGDDETLEITRWFAEEHGLVDEEDEP